mgnify:CR=1 FL=1
MLSIGSGISPTITDMHNQTFYRFDGTDQHITAHADTLSALQARVNDTTCEFSISVWVKIDSVSGSTFIFKFSESNDDNLIQLFYHNAHEEIRFAVKFAGGSAKVAKSGNNSGYEAGQDNDGWIHIAGRFGYSTDKVVLWVNGALVNASENNVAQTQTADATFDTLEIMQHSSGSYWDGDVDQLAVYGRVLSDADIRTIYTAGVGGLDLTSSTHVDNSNLIMYHRFEEKSGTVCINEAGTDSTYVNAPTVVEHNGAFS